MLKSLSGFDEKVRPQAAHYSQGVFFNIDIMTLSCNHPILTGFPQKNDALLLYGARAPKPFVFAYVQEDTEVVYGPAARPEEEIDTRRCMIDGVPVSRRRGGGGTVVLSNGMVITVVVGHRVMQEQTVQIYNRIHNGMIALLDPENDRGIHLAGISDLAINNRKILGSSLYLQQSPFFYYYQSALMVTSDIARISNYLAHPRREPAYRQGRTHKAFCTTLIREGIDLSPKEIAHRFVRNLRSYL